ncbi:MAG TPA: TolC family protein [Candidatus Angelobacter sp.]|nr:TolC family protein [Candidatus Angelobacter sp.]
MRELFIIGILGLGLTVAAVAQQEEPLSLQQAVAIALERSPQHKAALAETHAAKADVKEAQSFFFPRITFSEAATRSNDPVYVFGTRLRQSRFTAANFALNQLNNPKPIGNFATRFGGQWNVFDSFSTTFNARKARELKTASAERLARADQVILYRVIQSYYGVLFAKRQVELAEYAAGTAQAVADQSRSRFEAGTTVESDYLVAQVDVASRQQELVRARNSLALAAAELDLAMGVVADHSYRLTSELAERDLPTASLPESDALALKQRSDLKEVAAIMRANDAGLQAARSAYGPRINVFATSELNNVSPFSNGSNNWAAGAELQFDIFSGGQKAASVERARANVERMQALKQSAEDGIRLDVRRAYYDYDSAQQMLSVTKTATTQAEEGLRIVTNRYRAGMNTITDVLRAEDATRNARTNYWQAVYHYIVSYASLELATGSLNSQSPVVTP